MDAETARMWDCENPLVIGIGKEAAHAVWTPYDDTRDALSQNRFEIPAQS